MPGPITEHYQRMDTAEREFDFQFWQASGARAIFSAVEEMVRDYLLLRGNYADESRLQRTVEHFRRA